MKLFVLILLNLLHVVANAQQISIRAGKSFTPADFLSLRYEHWSNSRLHLCLGGYMERSFRSGLNYSAYGVDLLLNCYATNASYEDGRFGFKTGVGTLWQIEYEPWLYRDWTAKQRSSFGLTGEISGSWYMTEAFTLSNFFQQKILFNPKLGRSRFVVGIELAYRPGF